MTARGDLLDRLCARVLATRRQVGEAWPYHADPVTGVWQTVDDGDWCAGHWIEALRVVGERSGDESLIEEALARVERVRPKLERDDMFRAPRFYYSAARLHAATGDPRMRTLALAAAYAMRSMAMQVNGAMPIGTQVQVKSTTLASRSIVAVDNVHPNLILDWWAWRVTRDPVFVEGARAHLDLTARDFIRPDGSTIEFIEYDPRSGAKLREFTLLGCDDKSCWSRGQAWAIGGYLRAYEALGDAGYLAIARRLFDYWWDKSGPEIPPYDFADPDPEAPADSSAAAIVVESLARLAVLDPLPDAARPLVDRLDPMLERLAARVTPDGRLIDGCFNRPRRFADRAELVWGDFYLLSALHCLDRHGLPC